jgi:predicted nucleic acid-binding protein
MTRLVIDSHAWIEYFNGTEKGAKVREYLENPANIILTNSVTVAEIISKFERENKDTEQVWHALHSISKVIQVDSLFAKNVGEIHAEVKAKTRNFSLADAFALHTARAFGAKVLTGDPDFKGIKEALMI